MASKRKEKQKQNSVLSAKDLDDFVVKETKWNYKQVVPKFIRQQQSKASKLSFNLFQPKGTTSKNNQKNTTASSTSDKPDKTDAVTTETTETKEKEKETENKANDVTDESVSIFGKNIGIVKYNPPNYGDNGKWCYVIHNIFSTEECDELIDLCDKYKKKHHVAMLRNSKTTSVVDTRSRNHKRLLVDSKTIANEIFIRIKPFLPQLWPMKNKFDPNCDPNLAYTGEYPNYHDGDESSSKNKNTKKKNNDELDGVTFEWQHENDRELIGFDKYLQENKEKWQKEKEQDKEKDINGDQNEKEKEKEKEKENEVESKNDKNHTDNVKKTINDILCKDNKNDENAKDEKDDKGSESKESKESKEALEKKNKFDKQFKKWRPKCRKVLNCNERLRFLKYDDGEYFKPHYDGAYTRSNGETSHLTVLLYLNDTFTGGETTLLNSEFFGTKDDEWQPIFKDKWEKRAKQDGKCVTLGKKNHIAVKPRKGSVLLFQHDVFHEGSKLISGTKYLIRTDVMYSSKKYDL